MESQVALLVATGLRVQSAAKQQLTDASRRVQPSAREFERPCRGLASASRVSSSPSVTLATLPRM
jgi:hypothetical protein